MKPHPPIIIIDTREQKPYRFPSTQGSIRRSLAAGDYSLSGHEKEITIERKTKADAYGTLIKGRDRFMRELDKTVDMDRVYVLIECSLREFMQPPVFTKVNPLAALGSLLSLQVQYGFCLLFADNTAEMSEEDRKADGRAGMALVRKILTKYHKHFATT